RYVRQLQRLQLLFSPTAADARGARYRRRHTARCRRPPGRGGSGLVTSDPPDTHTHTHTPSLPPRSAAVNGTVREELIASKTSEEIAQLAAKLAGQSGLDIVRIRKPFHTDNPSVQGQWHPLTNKPSALTIQGPRLQPQ
ncbi:39S ribosomal protein L43, mitochondrial, partial [Spheniscus magellanicus]